MPAYLGSRGVIGVAFCLGQTCNRRRLFRQTGVIRVAFFAYSWRLPYRQAPEVIAELLQQRPRIGLRQRYRYKDR